MTVSTSSHAASATTAARCSTPGPASLSSISHGTYLMSNGQDPTDTRNADGRLPHVVHAGGWGPGTDARSIFGGDDFRDAALLVVGVEVGARGPGELFEGVT
ncbi:hypothetical protein GCM10010300_52510 [Streptomyces olivaceoviridis]|nr:hypothetical protein GCM10010300_52510 [Streptomyces olivaceoviridis]